MRTPDVIALLRKACKDAGTQQDWAKANKLSPAYVSDVLNGRRDPSHRIVDALGLERFVGFRKRTGTYRPEG